MGNRSGRPVLPPEDGDAPETRGESAVRELASLHAAYNDLLAERDELLRILRAGNGFLVGGPKERAEDLKRRLKRRLRPHWHAWRAQEIGWRQAARRGVRMVAAETVLRPLVWRRRLRAMDLEPAPSPFRSYQPMRAAMERGDYVAARTWGDALELNYGGQRGFTQWRRKLAGRDGSISANLDLSRRLAGMLPAQVPLHRFVEGRFRELTGWFPRIGGPAVPFEPRPGVVLHLVKESRPYLSNGFTSRSHENFKSELAAGLEPVVVTEPGFPRSVVGDDFEPVQVLDGVEHHRLDLGPAYGNVPMDEWLTDFAWLAYRKLLEIRPEVIHVSSGRRGYETALVGLALQEKTGLPLVYEIRSFFEGTWTSESAMDGHGETFRRRYAVETLCLQRADRVITLGEAMRDELVSRGVSADKIDLVPNGVNLENFVPAPSDESLRRRYGLTAPTFGYVSNMDHHREAQELLIHAAAELRDRGRDAQCVLVGGGARVEELKELAARLDLGHRVVFTGPVDHNEVAGHYGLIDVFVVPRIDERAARYVTPLKPFEAMALGLPVLVSDLPALTEIVAAPERGHVFRAGNAASLADEVEALLDDPDERGRLGRAGRAWIESSRQWKHNGPRYRETFRRAREAAADRKDDTA